MDGNYETSLSFRERIGLAVNTVDVSSATPEALMRSLPENSSGSPPHGTTSSDGTASCSLSAHTTPGRVVDCAVCLNSAAHVFSELPVTTIAKVLSSISSAGARGCTVDSISVSLNRL